MEITTHPYLVHSFWRSDLDELRRVRSCEALRADDPSLQDDDLRKLAVLQDLRYLDLSNTNITDYGMHHIVSLASLEVLRLNRTHVGNGGLEHLAHMEHLRELELDFTVVSDLEQAAADEAAPPGLRERVQAAWRNVGVGHLAALPRLEKLTLRGTGVHGPGLQYFADSPTLHVLSLGATAVNGRGLQILREIRGLAKLDLSDTATSLWPDGEGIASMQHLEALNLSGSWVSDAELRRFAECAVDSPLPGLVQLDLSRTRVTDDGLRCLDVLPRLHVVKLAGARVTVQGMRELEARRGMHVVADA